MKVGCETRAWTLVDRGADGTVGPETQVNYNGNKQSVCLHVRIGVITRKEQSRLRVCVVSVGAITKQHTFFGLKLFEEEPQPNQHFVYCAAHLSSRDWFFRIGAGRGLNRCIKTQFNCAAR